MTRAHRTDNNHAEIRDGLREAGWWVWDTHDMGNGFPDLIALNSSGRFVLLEVKSPGGKLTSDERDFFLTLIDQFHANDLYVVYDLQQATTALEKA